MFAQGKADLLYWLAKTFALYLPVSETLGSIPCAWRRISIIRREYEDATSSEEVQLNIVRYCARFFRGRWFWDVAALGHAIPKIIVAISAHAHRPRALLGIRR